MRGGARGNLLEGRLLGLLGLLGLLDEVVVLWVSTVCGFVHCECFLVSRTIGWAGSGSLTRRVP